MNKPTLENWRLSPHTTWAFHHVAELIPSARIEAGKPSPLAVASQLETAALQFQFEGRTWTVDEAVAATETDGLMVLHDGNIVHERFINGDAATPHILFSVSKSLTGMLAGILAAEGKFDPDAPVTHYVPEVRGSAYETATVRHVLDMTVSLDFVEDYLDSHGAFARYRDATGWNPRNPAFGNIGLHDFLCTLPRAAHPHGEMFFYASPNSDLLGWILERAGGESFATLMSRLIWRPLGAEYDGYVTVDHLGAARAAGGICVSIRDLARFAEMVRNSGRANGRQVVPQAWIEDVWNNGDAAAWKKGATSGLFPGGRYRTQWYITADRDPALCAIGIHGQWIYIDPSRGVTIVKTSSQRDPSNLAIDNLTVALFAALALGINIRS